MKKKGICASLLPNRNIQAEVFWRIISYTPFGVYPYLCLVLIEELEQIFLSLRLTFHIEFYENLIDQLKTDPQVPRNLLIISLVLAGFFVVVFCSVVYLYRYFKKHGTHDQGSTSVQVVCRSLSLLMVLLKTILPLPIQTFITLPLLYIGTEQYQSQNQIMIVQLVVSIILCILINCAKIIKIRMVNLVLLNNTMISSKSKHRRSDYYKVLAFFVIIALSLQPELNFVKRVFSQLFISVFCLYQSVGATLTQKYYNPKINYLNMVITTLKTSISLSQLLTILLQESQTNFIFIFAFISPLLLASVMMIKNWHEATLLNKLINGKSCTELDYEHLLYIFLHKLDSKNPVEIAQFDSIIMDYEEGKDPDQTSYYSQILRVLKKQQKMHRQFGCNIDVSDTEEELEKYAEDQVVQEDMDSDHMQSINCMPLTANQQIEFTDNSYRPTGMFHQLYECFSVDQLNHKRLEELDLAKQLKNKKQMRNQSDVDKALREIKTQFVYDVIIKNIIHKKPKSTLLLFFKAYLTLMHMNNKFLALTIISRIQVMHQNKPFLDQVESLVSQKYFLQKCLQKSKNENSHDQIQTQEYLEANLKITDFYQLLKDSSFQIGQFWQILSEQSLSRKQLHLLQRVSLLISEKLRKVKQWVNVTENNAKSTLNSQQIFFYLSYFFKMALRDNELGSQIFRQMLSMRTIIQASFEPDQVGLAIVDGNFNLYGQIIYINKILQKTLAYKNNELVNKTVHLIMPSLIAAFHNKFWREFSEFGIPKVLDQVRYLHVKDKNGYIIPARIYINFIYHHLYGYCFVGQFKNTKQFLFEDNEPSVDSKKAFYLITNEAGKIQEISKQFNKLTGLTPYIMEKLHGFLADGLTIQDFNPLLTVKAMDWSKHNSIHFKQLNLNCSIVSKYAKELEISEFFQQKENVTSRYSQNLKVQLKVIKESYGQNGGDVTLYYFVCSLLTDMVSVQNIESQLIKEKTSYFTAEQLSIAQEQESTGSDFGFHAGSKIRLSQDIASSELSSNNPNKLGGGSASMSSSYSVSSASKNHLSELKYIEDAIDYQKNPRPLLYLRLVFNMLLVVCIILAVILFAIDSQHEQRNQQYQNLLQYTASNEAILSDLQLMTRSYININLGLEPDSTLIMKNRKSSIQQIGMELVEVMRYNIKESYYFENLLDNQISEQSLTNQLTHMYELLPNNSVTVNMRSTQYLINQWLIKVFEVLSIDDFTSTTNTYLPKSSSPSSFDQTAFFIVSNGQAELKDAFRSSQGERAQLLNEQFQHSIVVNQIYVLITAMVILVLSIITSFFNIYVYQIKHDVLSYFAEVDQKVVNHCEKGALDFYTMIQTDNFDIIKKDNLRVNRWMENRLECEEKESTHLATHSQQKHRSQLPKHKQKKHKTGGNLPPEEFKNERDDDSFTNINELDKTQQPLKKNAKNRQNKYYEEEKEVELEIEEESIEFYQGEKVNKSILMRLHELRIRKLSQFIALGIFFSSILVMYFGIQYMLFERHQSLVNGNSRSVTLLYKSLECSSNFIFSVRELQVSNSTQYGQFNDGEPIQREMIPGIMATLNDTYYDCLSQYQKANEWLQTLPLSPDLNKLYQEINENKKLCNQISYQDYSQLSLEECFTAYDGIFQRSLKEMSSLFLQDTLYAAIRYDSAEARTEQYIKQQLSLNKTLNMIDSYIFYYMKAIQPTNERILKDIVTGSSFYQTVNKALFIMYLLILGVLMAVMHCHVFMKMKVSIWNAFIIFRLLPKQDIDQSLSLKLNSFLRKA